MRSAVWQGIGAIGLVEVPDPEPGPRDVVLDVAACGICGSDVHAYAEGAWITEGAPMGHEFAGTIREVGADVAGLAVGDRVAVNPMGPCRTCPQCVAGRTNLCRDTSSSTRGGLSDAVLVPDAVVDERLFRMPDSMTFTDGAFAYTAADAVEAFGLLASGHVAVAPLVSHRVPLSRVGEAFTTQHAVDDSVKVVVVPEGAAR